MGALPPNPWGLRFFGSRSPKELFQHLLGHGGQIALAVICEHFAKGLQVGFPVDPKIGPKSGDQGGQGILGIDPILNGSPDPGRQVDPFFFGQGLDLIIENWGEPKKAFSPLDFDHVLSFFAV